MSDEDDLFHEKKNHSCFLCFPSSGLENGAGTTNTVPRQNSLPTQLSFDYSHEAYTRCIDIQQVTLTGKSV
jgi:hypothetical protein